MSKVQPKALRWAIIWGVGLFCVGVAFFWPFHAIHRIVLPLSIALTGARAAYLQVRDNREGAA